MSRIAKNPIEVPKGVEIKLSDGMIAVKGKNGSLEASIHADVEVKQEDNVLQFAPRGGDEAYYALAGTTRAVVNNMVVGVSEGFQKKLQLVGVGYRAQVQGTSLNLTVGYSHPVVYQLPEGISAETPTQTEIIIKGADKQRVGQVAAEIRAVRSPEPYKGKGIRIEGEYIRRKEAKKK